MAAMAADAGTFSLLRQFFAYYRPHRKLFALDFSCAVISGVLELAFPLMAGLFVDRLLPSGDWTRIILAVALLFAVYVLNSFLMIVVTYWGHKLGISIETEMRRRSFDHLQKLSFRFYDNNKTGHLVGRVTKDLEEIGEVAHHGPEDAFVAVMTFIGAFVLMFLVNAKLAVITVLVVPPVTFVDHSLRRAHGGDLEESLPQRRRIQSPYRGKRRRHPRGASVRQRGSRAQALLRRQRSLSRQPSWTPTASWPPA